VQVERTIFQTPPAPACKTLAANHMKTILTLAFTVFSLAFVKAQTNELSSVLNSTENCPKVTTKAYSKINGFCSTSLHIDSDSTFTFESGCEGRSRVTIGKWKIIKDSLQLYPFKQSEIQPICNLELIGKESHDSSTIFIIKDKFGSPLNALLMPKGMTYDLHDPIMFQIMVNSWKDSLVIKTSKIDTLELPRLTFLTGKNYIFSTKELPAVVKITVNINSAALLYDEIVYVESIPKSWFIDKKKLIHDKLILELNK